MGLKEKTIGFSIKPFPRDTPVAYFAYPQNRCELGLSITFHIQGTPKPPL